MPPALPELNHVALPRVCQLLAAVVLASAMGCAAPSSARVVDGASYVGTAETAMQSDGIVFAPFELPVSDAPDAAEAFRCIDTANRAAADTLAARYTLREAPPDAYRRHGVPIWARGGGGRVAIHVESVRCGLVVADPTYAMAASDDPGGAEVPRGVVVLAVHDRMTGAVVVRVRGEAKDSDPLAAARAAAERAAEVLAPVH